MISQNGCAKKDIETSPPDTMRQSYILAIKEKIERNWKVPSKTSVAPKCEVQVIQRPGGIVVEIMFLSCNGSSKSYRDSIEHAIMKAEPFPKPPSNELFSGHLLFVFRPTR